MSLFHHQIWRNVSLHHCLSNGCSAVNGCRQNESLIKTVHQLMSFYLKTKAETNTSRFFKLKYKSIITSGVKISTLTQAIHFSSLTTLRCTLQLKGSLDATCTFTSSLNWNVCDSVYTHNHPLMIKIHPVFNLVKSSQIEPISDACLCDITPT